MPPNGKTPDKIGGMRKNGNPAVPSADLVTTAGDRLEQTGVVLAGLGLVLGLLLLFLAQTPVLLGLIPLGLLVMIAGHTKKTATATAAMLILQMGRVESNRVE